MNKRELKKYKEECLLYLEKVKAARKPVLKWICPHCHETNEARLMNKQTWNNKQFDHCTKGCYECGKPSNVIMKEGVTESFAFESPKIIHRYEQ